MSEQTFPQTWYEWVSRQDELRPVEVTGETTKFISVNSERYGRSRVSKTGYFRSREAAIEHRRTQLSKTVEYHKTEAEEAAERLVEFNTKYQPTNPTPEPAV